MSSKPNHSIADDLAEKIENRGNLIKTRKRDGYCIHVAKANDRIQLYSRTCESVTDRYPHIVEEFSDLPIPNGSLFSSEGVVLDKNRNDDYPEFTSIAKSGIAEALLLQEKKSRATFMPFNIYVWGNKDVTRLCNADRFEMLNELLDHKPSQHIIPMEFLDGTFAEAKALARKNNWEGLVVYDSTKGTTYRLDGNFKSVPRPAGSYKSKPVSEDDFFVEEFSVSTAKSHAGAVKDFILLQYDSKGRKRNCGKCGIGISKADRTKYLDKSLYPLVFEVRFDARYASGSLKNGRIYRPRTDKRPEECRFPSDKVLRSLPGTFKKYSE